MLVLKVRPEGLPACPGETMYRSRSSKALSKPAGKPGVNVSDAPGITFRKESQVRQNLTNFLTVDEHITLRVYTQPVSSPM